MHKRERAIPMRAVRIHPFRGQWGKIGGGTKSSRGDQSSLKLKGMPRRANSPMASLLNPASVSLSDKVEPVRGSGSALAKPINASIK